MKNICIGLFGTCDNSKWREPFIKQYKDTIGLDYFNPDAGDNWHPGMIDDENRHLMEDDIILFPVLSESLGLGSLGEIGFSTLNVMRNIQNGSNQHLIVMIDDECTSEKATESERTHSNRTRKLVKSKLLKITHPNIIVVEELHAMALATTRLVEVLNEHKLIRENYNIS